MAGVRESETENYPVLEDVPMSRRAFLRLSIAGIVGLPTLLASACKGGREGGGGGGKGKKGKKGNGGGGGGY